MKTRNLTEGNIYKELISLSLPIMATSFIQMSYNLMDLFWLGRLSIEAVAAAGTVGFWMVELCDMYDAKRRCTNICSRLHW